MENKGFFQTKEGGLTIAFIVIMVAFAVIMTGLGTESGILCTIGFLLIVAAMLYSPIKVQIIDRLKKK